MEFIIISIISIICILILGYIFNYNIKEIKKVADDEELDTIAKEYPSNIEICKYYLKKLNNEKVKIEENKESESSLYIAVTDKISIANVSNTYTRIQTIAHECLHSIQDRKILLFNFIFSNIYLVYFFTICILAIFKVLPYKMLFLIAFLILALIYYMIRIYLENDAMIKAKYLAKEYVEEVKISKKEEIEKLVVGFDKVTNVGVKCINYTFFLNIMIKVLILSLLFIIR